VPLNFILLSAILYPKFEAYGADGLIGILGGVIAASYIVSFTAFFFLRKVTLIKLRKVLLKLGNIGIGFLVIGQASFTLFYLFIGKGTNIHSWTDHLFLLFYLALMVFYVYYCNNEQRDLDI
jgi:hypothetical protein